MVYKVVYIEDLDADSVLHDLSQYDLNIVHCKPSTFIDTISNVDKQAPDLILMDFRLMEGGGEVDAPSIAQYYRSRSIDEPPKSIPIVLLSNDRKIQGYYKDYTSHDLFDFSISKEHLSDKKEKYAQLISELIDSYKSIYKLQIDGDDLAKLIAIPKFLENEIDPRIIETLSSEKYKSNIYMASAFILNSVVKPIGVLIGEDVLSARLGIDKSSADWEVLCKEFDGVQYNGLYSGTYRRWWSSGVDSWWASEIDNNRHLRRLSSEQKLEAILRKRQGMRLGKVIGDPTSKTESYWSICQYSFIPVDPSEAFEIQTDLTIYPWLDSEYYSYESVRNQGLNEYLTELERVRYREIARGN
ncbi:hypothetical protein [Shewanella algae]|uniref:hypothetical protein n=1 Tax=Shewanella algae TaxID=38313 RepID=UPI0031F4AD94